MFYMNRNKLRRFIAAGLAGCVMICGGLTGAAAEEREKTISEIRQVMPDEPEYGEFIADYVRRIIDYLSVYAKEGTTQASFYRAALLEVLEQHPELYEEVMTAVLSSIDEHSVFYTGGEFNEFISTLESSVGGVGITVSEDGEKLFAASVLENTPAARAGIMAGDVLYSADGVPLEGLDIDAALGKIRGQVGSSLVLGVIREGEPEVLYFTLVREEIGQKESVVYKIFPSNGEPNENGGNNDIMYIKIYTFMDNTAELFKDAMKAADDKKINNIIIDVRDNGGGYINQAAEIANYFVPEGKTIVTEDHKVDLFDIVYRSDNKRTQKNDVVVLVNGNSASASEILTAALTENEVAVAIGEKTYGKGTVQSMITLKDDEAMKYTSAYYLTPLGNNIDGVGITPKAEVKNGSVPFDITDYPDFAYTGVYSRGDSSPEVAKAKKILSVWGMYAGDITNPEFDMRLEQAVARFQAQEGLFAYGVLDYTTQRRIYEALAETKVMTDDQMEAAFNHFGETYLNREK